jgi:F-type H+-transporting ATPase subunit b
MNVVRIVVCLAMVCAVGSLRATTARSADDVKTAVEHAEGELSKAAHTDPSSPDLSTEPLSFDPDLAWFTLLVFVLLLIVLKKFAWGPIIAALETREKNVAEHIAQAERNHEAAKGVLADYEKKLAAAANEVRALLEEARRDAEHTKQSILAEAKAGAEAERARALRDIEAAADQAMESLAKRSADLAVDLAGKILQATLSKDDHSRLIQEALAKFPSSSSNN